MSSRINRRNFLKIMGWGGVGTGLVGCDMPSTVTLEEGKEEVVSYFMPEEYVIPGVGVWYASTCQQCAAGCGVHGRVREGRILKLEGNPGSEINEGKMCQMGQAGVQAHFNPDRIRQPMLRDGGSLKAISWDEAFSVLKKKTAGGNRSAWFTGTVSGHQAVLIDAHLKSIASSNHFVHEVINTSVLQAVSKDMFGTEQPRYRIDNAGMVLSFNADFLGTWISPVHFAREFAAFRAAKQRGLLVSVEPKMSLTGANADLWLPVKPGTEGLVAIGIAKLLVEKHKLSAAGLSEAVRQQIAAIDLNHIARLTGVAGHRIQRVTALLLKRAPSLVLAGPSVGAHENGYEATAAIMMLNILLGNVGKTVEPPVAPVMPSMATKLGDSRSLVAFAEALKRKQLDTVFFYGSNPLYTAPDSLGLKELLSAAAPFKVSLSQFADETSVMADLILPLDSSLEDWGTHVPGYQTDTYTIGIQQPLMERLYDTRGFGDVVLTMLKQSGSANEFAKFSDYYSYLRNAFNVLPGSIKPSGKSNDEFWNQTLQAGLLKVSNTKASSFLRSNMATAAVSVPKEDEQYPLALVPSARLGLWDGRHANLPWLQEAPDQIAKVVWDSWAEMHPTTAEKLGIKHGDIIKVSSANGELKVKAYLFKGVHQDAIAIPLGQGHDSYGRYANGIGVKPLKILAPASDKKTGELALYATRVAVSKTGEKDIIVKMGSSEQQAGRRLVRTITSDQLRRTEGV